MWVRGTREGTADARARAKKKGRAGGSRQDSVKHLRPAETHTHTQSPLAVLFSQPGNCPVMSAVVLRVPWLKASDSERGCARISVRFLGGAPAHTALVQPHHPRTALPTHQDCEAGKENTHRSRKKKHNNKESTTASVSQSLRNDVTERTRLGKSVFLFAKSEERQAGG